MHTFRLFSPTHAAVVVCFAAAVVALVALRRRLRDPSHAERLDRILALFAFVVCLVTNAWPLLPWHFRLDWSLPLHVCDLVTMCVPFAIASDRRPTRAILYFWGLGLCTQGFITPDLTDGPAHFGFWNFWLAHATIVGGALYDVLARGYRPTWRDFRLTLLIDLAYVAVILPLDVLLGVNYGFVGPTAPAQPSIVDALGPWPLRVPVILALGVAATALLMLPWEVVRRVRGKHDAAYARPDRAIAEQP